MRYKCHKKLGPGFLESIYQSALPIELHFKGLRVEEQKEVKIFYDNTAIGTHIVDLIVDEKVIVELKAVKDFHESHMAQVLSYLKATRLKVGLLLNFSHSTLKKKYFNKPLSPNNYYIN